MTPLFDELPIFPLPRLVLMPGAILPLHVFEPRYRALVHSVASGIGLLGLATLRPGFEDQYDASPPVFPEVGVARLVDVRRLPDGRSNIVVEHVASAEILEELPSREPFRLVRARMFPDDPSRAGAEVAELRRVLREVAATVGVRPELDRLLGLSDRGLVDTLALDLIEEPDDRRAWLRMPSLRVRARALSARLLSPIAARLPAAEA
jgi:Lon protease-like protein